MVSRNTEFNTDRFYKAYGIVNSFGRYRNMNSVFDAIHYLEALPLDRNRIAKKDLPAYDAFQYFNHCRLRHPEKMTKALDILKLGFRKVHDVNYPELLAEEYERNTATRKIQTIYRGHLAKKTTNQLNDDIVKFLVADTKEEEKTPKNRRIHVMKEGRLITTDKDRILKQRLGTAYITSGAEGFSKSYHRLNREGRESSLPQMSSALQKYVKTPQPDYRSLGR